MRRTAGGDVQNLIIDMCVSLSPCQVVSEDGVGGVTDGSPIKHGGAFQLCARQVLAPKADVVASETGGHQGDELACAPACGHHHLCQWCHATLCETHPSQKHFLCAQIPSLDVELCEDEAKISLKPNHRECRPC